MKKWILLLLFVGVLLWQPLSGSNVAQLKPVEVIRVSVFAGQIYVETDTGDAGMGRGLGEAFSDLKKTANGEIFLETADRLLISPTALELLPELTEYLRPGCNVCVEMSAMNLDEVSGFLDIHEPGVTLQDHQAGSGTLPVLYTIDGRMYLIE